MANPITDTLMSAEIVQELLADPPRSLTHLQAELLFVEGTYLFRQRGDKIAQFKALSPSVLRAAFSQEPIDSGWLAPQVVRWGTTQGQVWVVQFIPAQVQTITIEEQPLAIPLPSLVFAGRETTYWLWALKTPTFDPNAIAQQVPLPNVYANGRICWGRNTAPVVSGQAIVEAWRLFIGSPFGQDLSSGKSQAYPNDVRLQLRQVAKRKGVKSYPLRDLRSTHTRIGPLLE